MNKHIPNLVSSLNLLAGCISIAIAFYDVEFAVWLIFLAIILDFLDGFLARLLRAQSELGKQLDSLADIVSFGVAPAVILYLMFLKSWNLPALSIGYLYITPFISFLIPVFSALRLAKFNLDQRQSGNFYGLPTPANALLIISVPMIIKQYGNSSGIGDFALDTIVLVALTLTSSYLLVSGIQLLSFKFKHYRWQENQLRYSFILLAIVLLIIFQFAAIPFIIALYIILSLIFIKEKRS